MAGWLVWRVRQGKDGKKIDRGKSARGRGFVVWSVSFFFVDSFLLFGCRFSLCLFTRLFVFTSKNDSEREEEEEIRAQHAVVAGMAA